MGLGISVGMLYDMARNDTEGLKYHQDAFYRLTEALADKGVTWQEPECTEPPSPDVFSGGFPYGYLTNLRRILVLTTRGEPITPMPERNTSQYDRDLSLIDDETSMLDSHLLCHSDGGGYYVPVDFADPIFLPVKENADLGGMVGSSQRLLAELCTLAPALGVRLEEGGALSAEESARLAGTPSSDPFDAEKFAWHQLFRACRASVAGGHALVFS